MPESGSSDELTNPKQKKQQKKNKKDEKDIMVCKGTETLTLGNSGFSFQL